jgi:hypothetical protein
VPAPKPSKECFFSNLASKYQNIQDEKTSLSLPLLQPTYIRETVMRFWLRLFLIALSILVLVLPFLVKPKLAIQLIWKAPSAITQ